MIRKVVTHADLEVWTRVRNAVETYELSTVEDMRRELERDPDRLFLLAELDGGAVGCAFVSRSESGSGVAFALPRVRPAARRRGVGTALLRACSAHARELGCRELRCRADGDDAGSLAFGARFGFVEVDRQVELVRALMSDERSPEPPPGVEIVQLGPQHLETARILAAEAASDMPLDEVRPDAVEAWVEELARCKHAVVALDEGEVAGFAGLVALGARPGVLENAFTAVRRTHRRRGIATGLKQALIVWAAANGYREIVTWTQQGNAAMQAVNDKVGYRPGHVSITLCGPLL